MSEPHDSALGMNRAISRRDFLNGVAVGIGGAAAWPFTSGCGPSAGAPPVAATAVPAEYYPPSLMGMRGSHEGSYTDAHALRDGSFWTNAGAPTDTAEHYDLVVVGGGISGLAAAHFFRARAGRSARILILDNHDDFGGHAKRNEFRAGSRVLIGYGGTQTIEYPSRYSEISRGLLTELGVDVQRFYTAFDQTLYKSLKLQSAVFFDKETFGQDHLAVGVEDQPWAKVLERAPLTQRAAKDIARIYEAPTDYMPGLSVRARQAKLAKMSYRDYLAKVARVDVAALPFFQTMTHDLFGVGIEAVAALDCFGLGLPGFQGLKLPEGSATGMGRTAILEQTDEPFIFHFPDGNASIARLLVRSLVPEAVPGASMDDIVTAKVDYGKLDRAESGVRVRLNSTVVRARHDGDPAAAREVEVTYAHGKELKTVRGSACVLACWNGVIPYLCPELPEKQKEALAYGVKVPLVYTNVAIQNWTAFQKLGVSDITAPGGFHSFVALDDPVSLGTYQASKKPEEPMVLHMVRTPCSPGLEPRMQHRAGRAELLSMTFETFERNVRNQLGRMLGDGGFDPARDIVGITVNRWPHGYSYEYSSLWDPAWPPGQQPCEIGRRKFGRMTIANADSAAYAYTDAAIDQAYRAVGELLAT